MLRTQMQHRALALALALLLLVTQQFGLQHLLSHGNAAASWVTAGAAADASPDDDGQPADGSCAVCAVLASIAFAALPAPLLWLTTRRRGSAPQLLACETPAARSNPHYLARAPPAALH
ncbi:MAG: hypothetical protein EBY28_17335 [Betaproteobacteria bacterium]|nr:hypothetical protein [Betaproteobacteria bacterium]